MENEINKGGRPPAEVTNERICEIMKMFYRGGCNLGAIMNELGISQTAASNLRKKAFKAIQVARGEDNEIIQGKYILNFRLEYLFQQAWRVIGEYDRPDPSCLVNPKNDLIKLKYFNLILSILRSMAELNGHIGSNQTNFISIQQKILMNILNLNEKDFDEKNIKATMLKLADIYKNKLEEGGEKNDITYNPKD